MKIIGIPETKKIKRKIAPIIPTVTGFIPNGNQSSQTAAVNTIVITIDINTIRMPLAPDPDLASVKEYKNPLNKTRVSIALPKTAMKIKG